MTPQDSSICEDTMKQGYGFGMAAAIILAAWSVPGLAQADEEYGPFKEMKTSAGTVLTDQNGMTLYTYDKDEKGKSNCVDQCAVNWPPAMATATDKPAGDLSVIKRPDGTLQWADDGKPLYTFIKDKKPGDVTGDNVKEVWHVVKE
jgi:predicted lipoprotein with Yx(FWY)xxD motif